MDEIAAMGRIFLARRRREAERIRGFAITVQQLALIGLARRRGAIAPSEAAAALFCDRPTATVIARNCVARGWLKRRQSQGDRRSHRLELTGEGEELLDLIEAARLGQEPAANPLDVLDPEERRAFAAALRKVEGRALELYGGEKGPSPRAGGSTGVGSRPEGSIDGLPPERV